MLLVKIYELRRQLKYALIEIYELRRDSGNTRYYKFRIINFVEIFRRINQRPTVLFLKLNDFQRIFKIDTLAASRVISFVQKV